MSQINLKLPISPQEAQSLSVTSIPAEIFEAINSLLIERTGPSSKEVTLKQDLILTRYNEICIQKNVTPLKWSEIFEKKYLDIEHLYEKAGWSVEYDKPVWNETYDAFFVFKPNKKS